MPELRRFSSGSSPLTRGAPVMLHVPVDEIRLIPAYAGSTTRWRLYSQPPRAHPRLRGEHDLQEEARYAAKGSSPLTRGARGCCRSSFHVGGLIPAYAGSTSSGIGISATLSAHPRLRGEHQNVKGKQAPRSGSSPLTRGALDAGGSEYTPGGLIPAYAGSTVHWCRLRHGG